MKADSEQQVFAIVQARMDSKRLPGKILADIQGQPMIMRVVERTRKASCLKGVILATTTDPSDDEVADLCQARGYPTIRGHATDVLDRYHHAASLHDVDVIVRVTGDCPLMDPEVIDRTVSAFLASDPPADYASNRIVPTYPVGLDVEVFTREALQRAHAETKVKYQREHVTPYFYESPGRFHVVSVESGGEYGGQRWTVDTAEDLQFVREIFRRLKDLENFGWRDVLHLLEQEPELAQINAHVRQRTYLDAE